MRLSFRSRDQRRNSEKAKVIFKLAGMLLKIFRVNAAHNVFHLAIGIGPTPGYTS